MLEFQTDIKRSLLESQKGQYLECWYLFHFTDDTNTNVIKANIKMSLWNVVAHSLYYATAKQLQTSALLESHKD